MVEESADSAVYAPQRGDVIWITFEPHLGHEQAGRRPALVLSASDYNRRVGLAIVCPITRRAKRYPFEVALDSELEVDGIVLSDHVKNVDWRERRAEFICTVPNALVNRVVTTLQRVIAE